MTTLRSLLCLVFVCIATTAAAQSQSATVFTYQGYLEEDGGPAAGTYDLRFILYDSDAGGSQVGNTATREDVITTGGVFAVDLDFGAVFGAEMRYLEVAVRDGESTGSFTTLSPREAVRPTPTALSALSLPNVTVASDGKVGIGTETPTSELTVSGAIETTMGGIIFPDGSSQTTAGVSSGNAWSLGGNAGTDPSSGDYLGTSDSTPMELRVGNFRALRIELAKSSSDVPFPNLIGGHPSNQVTDGVFGATIGGGGAGGDDGGNVVEGNWGTVGGGYGNVARGNKAAVGGGEDNLASGILSSVGGGFFNRASGMFSTGTGGSNNTISGDYATVGGGQGNTANGSYATVSGGRNNTTGDSEATVGGGSSNTADGDGATVAGGSLNTAGDSRAAVGGGEENIATGRASIVGGGSENTASNLYSTVGGGLRNLAGGYGATVAGGQLNMARGAYTAVGGGIRNVASGSYSTVAGGLGSEARSSWGFAAGYYARVAEPHDGSFVWADASTSSSGDNTQDSLVTTGANQFLIRAVGGVGIGTNDPRSQLHVESTVSGSALARNHVALIENNATSGGDVLALKTSASTPGVGENFITFKSIGADVGAIEGNGSGGVSYKTGGADFAEMLPRVHTGETIAPGTIVGVTGGRISKATSGADRLMVVTDRAAVIGNAREGDAATSNPVSFIGQVPVRVEGPVEVGDWIVASGRNDGIGRAVASDRWTPDRDGPIVGQAWAAQAGGVGRVNIAVGLDTTPALVGRLREQQRTINEQRSVLTLQQQQMEQLEQRLRRLEALLKGLTASETSTVSSLHDAVE